MFSVRHCMFHRFVSPAETTTIGLHLLQTNGPFAVSLLPTWGRKRKHVSEIENLAKAVEFPTYLLCDGNVPIYMVALIRSSETFSSNSKNPWNTISCSPRANTKADLETTLTTASELVLQDNGMKKCRV